MNKEEKKVYYLQLLQEPISRMSATSAIFKGFSAAIIAGLATATISDLNKWALVLGLVPILSFGALDVFYLSLERKLKYRYLQVIEEKIELDYKINTKLNKKEKKDAKSSIFQCMLSPSIWMFYGPVLTCSVVLIILRTINVI